MMSVYQIIVKIKEIGQDLIKKNVIIIFQLNEIIYCLHQT